LSSGTSSTNRVPSQSKKVRAGSLPYLRGATSRDHGVGADFVVALPAR